MAIQITTKKPKCNNQTIEHTKVWGALKDIKKQIADKETAINKLDKEIERLEHDKDKVGDVLDRNIEKTFKTLERENETLKTVRKKITELNNIAKRAHQTQEDLMEFYRQCFNHLTTKRIVIPKKVFRFEEAYADEQLTLYSKGFGKNGETYRGISPSKPLTEWRELQKVFGTPGVADRILKKDKVEMFYAFSQISSNWIDVEVELRDLDEINIKSGPGIPYIDNVEYKTSYIKSVTLNSRVDEDGVSFDFEDEEYAMHIDDLTFGQLFAIAFIWSRFQRPIDELTARLKSIVENNELLLWRLKKNISHLVVAEAL